MLRMTIRAKGRDFQVFKMKPESSTPATGGGYRKTSWFVSRIATPQFSGSYAACLAFIQSKGAQFMSEQGLPV